jgi:hypothetical protein
MKFTNLLMSTLIVCSSLSATFAQADEQHHGLETDKYSTLYFNENALGNDFDFEVYNPNTDEMVTLPYGSADYPHAVIARVTNNKVMAGAFGLSDITSAFADTQEEAELALRKKLRGGMIGAEEGMIFLNINREIVDNPANAVAVVIPNSLNSAMDSFIDVAMWKECSDKYFRGNYSGYNCSRGGRYINKDFKSFLNKNALKCVNAGLSKIGKKRTKSLHIVHGGIIADKRHSRRSLHAASRAIDIRTIIVHGGKTKMSYPRARAGKKTEMKFYNAFAQCWSDRNIARDSHCKKRRGRNGYAGIIRWEDRNHGKHMHASMPSCRTNTYMRK